MNEVPVSLVLLVLVLGLPLAGFLLYLAIHAFGRKPGCEGTCSRCGGPLSGGSCPKCE